MQADFLKHDDVTAKAVRWKCLPVPGSMRGRKVDMMPAPPPKAGSRRIVTVDSFAGGGGASNGMEEALGRLQARGLLPSGHSLDVDYAINHDEPALVMHEANHPRTVHLPHNVWQVSMRETLGDDYFGLLWLSPDCRDHSPAKGGPITSRAVRDLAWVLVKWLKELPDWQRPWTICLENVGAFAKWSPLVERPDGRGLMRDVTRLGWTFHQFVHALASYGYSVGWCELRSCDFGDPTIRKRLYLCARRDRQKIEIPAPTHGDPKSAAVASGALQPWPVAADIIDFGLDCPSIFLTKEEARAYTKATGKRIIRPLAAKTDARLAYGVKRHVLDAGDDAFVVTCNHAGEGFRGQGIGDPFATVAKARDAHGLVVPNLIRTDQTSVEPTRKGVHSVREPLRTVSTGGSFAEVESTLIPHIMTMRNSGKPTQAADEPTHTVMAGGANQFSVETAIAPFIKRDFGNSIGSSMQEPAGAVMSGGGGKMDLVEAKVAPFVSRGQHGGGNRPAGEPLHTIAASDGDQHQAVATYLVPRYGERDGQEPRSASVERPMPTPVPDGNGGSLAAVYLAQHNGGPRAPIGRPADKPLSTATVEGSQQQVVAAHMLSLKGSERRDGACTDAHPAVCAGGQHSAVVTLPLISAYYGEGGFCAKGDTPLPTASTKDRFGLTQIDAVAPPLTPAQYARARQVAEFLRRHGCWDGGELVTLTLRGTVYVIVDIGMRMLTPRELARAQGFPDSYRLDPIYRGKPLSETEQRHKIGNSVTKKPAAAFIEANYRPPMEWGESAFLEAAE